MSRTNDPPQVVAPKAEHRPQYRHTFEDQESTRKEILFSHHIASFNFYTHICTTISAQITEGITCNLHSTLHTGFVIIDIYNHVTYYICNHRHENLKSSMGNLAIIHPLT